MKKGFSVKFETREIIVTKKFLKAAETYGSEEFLKEPLFTFLEEEGLDLSDVHFIKQSEVPGMVI